MCRSRNRSWIWKYYFNLILFLVACESGFIKLVECDRSGLGTSTTTEPPDKNKPGIVKKTFEGNESSWVPGLSAAVIVIIVFLISIFACCIHCPFCIVYRRNDPQRVV